MDALTIAKPKRDSGYIRMRKKADYLSKDVAALERLVGTLLNHLERAIDPAVTEQDRARFRTMITEIRGTLAEDGVAPEKRIAS